MKSKFRRIFRFLAGCSKTPPEEMTDFFKGIGIRGERRLVSASHPTREGSVILEVRHYNLKISDGVIWASFFLR